MSEPDTGLQTLKQYAPELYLACLYLPEKHRAEIATLWAFDAEIRRIPALVSEPIPGEIRIQWWRDLIRSGNNAGSGPLAEAVMKAIDAHDLPRETFDACLEARIFDLYQDPMPDTGTLEGYLGETVSPFFHLSSLILGAERNALLADASGHAGMALGLSRLLSGCAQARAREQVFLPADILAKHGLDREGWLEGETGETHANVILELCSLNQYHLTYARKVLTQLPQEIRRAFLPLATVEPVLKRIRQSPGAVFSAPLHLSPLRRYWTILRAALRNMP